MNKSDRLSVCSPAALGVVMLALCALPLRWATAETFGNLDSLSQAEFLDLSEQLSAATLYRSVAPAEPLGITGFDIGIGVSSTQLDKAVFTRASGGDFDPGSLVMVRAVASKGLPFGIDIGASLGAVPGEDITLAGAEVKLALLEGGVATPAVALRASLSRLQGLDELRLDNQSLDVSVSKGFLMVTPYAGAGIVRSKGKPDSTSPLQEESFRMRRLFAGVTLNLGVAITLEMDRVDDRTSYSAKAGFRF